MNITGKLIVAAVTHTDTRIWATDAHRGDKPEVVARPSAEHIHHHVRNEQQTTHGHETNRFEHPYLESVAAALEPAGQILLIGHGKGKSNSMLKLIQHLERHHPKTAEKFVAALDINVPALTEPQILAAAREWFEDHEHG
jgi:hypothetical protein